MPAVHQPQTRRPALPGRARDAALRRAAGRPVARMSHVHRLQQLAGNEATARWLDTHHVASRPAAASVAAPAAQRQTVTEKSFPGGGKVDDVRPGGHLLWNFEIGSAALTAGHLTAIPRLAAEVKNALTRDPSAVIDIEGQASLTGTHNDELAEKRANAVRDALVKQGIKADRFNVIAVGALKSRAALSQENLARSRAVRLITPPHLLLTQPNQPTPLPSGSCAIASLLTVATGSSVESTINGPFRKLVAGSGNGNPPGMRVGVLAQVPPPGCGSFPFVQNVDAFRQFVYKDRTRNTFQSAGFVLDTSNPYRSQVFPSPGPNLVNVGANDSPSQSVDNLTETFTKTLEAPDAFRMFGMFTRPVGAPQVLHVVEWSWVGLLKNDNPDDLNNGNLVKQAGASRVTPQSGAGSATGDAPVTSPDCTTLSWTTDNAGDPNRNTLANIHRRVILDRSKPSADPR